MHISVANGGEYYAPETLVLTIFFLIISYTVNSLSPKIAGYVQVSTTFIKLIPLLMIMVGGIVYGLLHPNGMLVENFTSAADAVKYDLVSNPLMGAVVTTAFAYEGWIVATSINAELKNAKRNLPIALLVGGVVIAIIYISYYVGVAGGADKHVLMEKGATISFTNIYGSVLGLFLDAFVVISCFGTLNGLMIATSRGLYSLAARNRGPNHEMFMQVDRKTNMPNNSAVMGLLICMLWLVYFYCSQLSADPSAILGKFVFDSSELPIVTMYPLYIPIFFMFIVRGKGVGFFKRIVIPFFAIIASLAMVFAAIYSHGIVPYFRAQKAGEGFTCPVLFYLIVFAVIMIFGMLFVKEKKVLHPNQKKKKK